MQNPLCSTTLIFVAFFALSACEDGTKTTASDDKQATAEPKEKSKSKPIAEKTEEVVEVEPPKPIVRHFAPPLQTIPPTADKWLASLPAEPIGTLSGEVYGDKQGIYGISRASCGEGSVLQFAFKDTKNKMRISAPIPLRFHGLATKKEVGYEEGGFAVGVNFEKDDGKTLKGEMAIAYMENGTKKIYAKAVVDGPVTSHLFEPKLAGKGNVPFYEWCTPNGYFRLEDKKGKVTTGLMHIATIGDTKVPQARVLLSPEDGIDIATIPLAKGKTIDNVTVDMTTARKKGTNPAVVLGDLWRLEPLATPEEATGKTLHRREEAKLLSGKAIINYTKRGKKWQLEYTLNDATFSPLIGGPLSGYEIKELKFMGWPSEPNAMTATMPPKPDWYP